MKFPALTTADNMNDSIGDRWVPSLLAVIRLYIDRKTRFTVNAAATKVTAYIDGHCSARNSSFRLSTKYTPSAKKTAVRTIFTATSTRLSAKYLFKTAFPEELLVCHLLL